MASAPPSTLRATRRGTWSPSVRTSAPKSWAVRPRNLPPSARVTAARDRRRAAHPARPAAASAPPPARPPPPWIDRDRPVLDARDRSVVPGSPDEPEPATRSAVRSRRCPGCARRRPCGSSLRRCPPRTSARCISHRTAISLGGRRRAGRGTRCCSCVCPARACRRWGRRSCRRRRTRAPCAWGRAASSLVRRPASRGSGAGSRRIPGRRASHRRGRRRHCRCRRTRGRSIGRRRPNRLEPRLLRPGRDLVRGPGPAERGGEAECDQGPPIDASGGSAAPNPCLDPHPTRPPAGHDQRLFPGDPCRRPGRIIRGTFVDPQPSFLLLIEERTSSERPTRRFVVASRLPPTPRAWAAGRFRRGRCRAPSTVGERAAIRRTPPRSALRPRPRLLGGSATAGTSARTGSGCRVPRRNRPGPACRDRSRSCWRRRWRR